MPEWSVVSSLTVSVELAPLSGEQSSVVMRPHTATTFGPLVTVALGLLVSGLLWTRPHSRLPNAHPGDTMSGAPALFSAR